MKADELWFFEECCKYCSNHGRDLEQGNKVDVFNKSEFGVFGGVQAPIVLREMSPQDIIQLNEHKINYKRALYLLKKWVGKGWYDYNVSVASGWITIEGNKKYMEILENYERKKI